MEREWKVYRIEEIADEMGDAPFGSLIKSDDYKQSGALVVQGLNIQGRNCDWTNTRFVSEEKFASLRRSHCKIGDLLFPKVGTIGKVGLLTEFPGISKYVLSTNTMRLRPNQSIALSDFVYYFFTWSKTAQLIHSLNSNSVQPVFNFTSLKNFQIRLPSIRTQSSIVRVLKGLDDKIELNRRMNETLEAMARALFKSWFVDFDPVRAKIDGRLSPGIDSASENLFPDHFQDSSMGSIPKGWKVGRLDEIAMVIMGLSPDGDSYNADGIGTPLINGPVEFGEYFPIKSKWTQAATRFAVKGDLIFCVRGSTTGRRVVSDDTYCIGRGVCAIRAKDKIYSFLYQTINFGLDSLLQKTTGSVFPNLSSPDIKEFSVLRPTSEILELFESATSSLVNKIQLNHREICNLTKLRETLLPWLLSGET